VIWVEKEKELRPLIGIAPELYSALTAIGLEKGKRAEQILEETLEKDPEIKKMVDMVRKEPDVGVLAVGPTFRRRFQEDQKKIRTE
jgi:hypothetical protein